MPWIFVPGMDPSTPSICAPGEEGSPLGSNSSSETAYAPWLTLSGKAVRRPLSWPGWEKRRWISLLSGTISAPSTAAAYADAYISSLLDTPASPSATPESVVDDLIRATCGPTSAGWLSRFVHGWYSWRTSEATLALDFGRSEQSFSSLVTELRQDYSARKKWALRTFGSGCLLWPTPLTSDQFGAREDDGKRGLGLTSRVREWPQGWPTPRAQDGPKGGPNQQHGTGDLALPSFVTKWPTPQAADAKRETDGIRGASNPTLGGASKQWPTPKGTDAKGADPARKKNRSGKRHAGDSLPTVTERNWPTPSARDWKGSPDTARAAGDGTSAQRLDQLDRVTENFPYSRRDQRTHELGLGFSQPVRTLPPLCRLLLLVYRSDFLRRWLRLNPAFSEWLMGWPVGWSACKSLGTEWSRWWRAWRSHLFGTNYDSSEREVV